MKPRLTAALAAVAAVALLACAAPRAIAQAPPPPSRPECDSAGVLAKAQPVYNAGPSRLHDACPAFDKVLADFAALNPEYAAAVERIRHGAPKPPPPVVVTPPAVVDAPPSAPPSVASWTKLGAGGQLYAFAGLRDVCWTYSTCDASGALRSTVYALFPCGYQFFGNRGPSGGSGNGLCFDGPPQTETIAATPMGPIVSPSIVVPKASPGVGVAQVRDGGGNGVVVDGSGSFRTTCSPAKFRNADPVVAPGVATFGHLHMFFGNVAMDERTTTATIATTGNSTCRGGTLNRSGYWVAAMIDDHGNAVLSNDITVYYKTGYNLQPARTQPMPTGLVMIAGNKNATGKQMAGPQQIATWSCLTPELTGAGVPDGYTIPVACPVGAMVRLTVIFPQCWDGRNLDSPDHQSHMSYPAYSSAGRFSSACPAAFPVQLPEVTEHFDWPVTPGAKLAAWHLSSDMDLSKPGGISAHADWMMGWDAATMRSLVENCLQKGLDCGIGGIGANKILY